MLFGKYSLGCHFTQNQLGDLKLNLFTSVSIDIFIFWEQKIQKCDIHLVTMWKEDTKGGGIHNEVGPVLILVQSLTRTHTTKRRQNQEETGLSLQTRILKTSNLSCFFLSKLPAHFPQNPSEDLTEGNTECAQWIRNSTPNPRQVNKTRNKWRFAPSSQSNNSLFVCLLNVETFVNVLIQTDATDSFVWLSVQDLITQLQRTNTLVHHGGVCTILTALWLFTPFVRLLVNTASLIVWRTLLHWMFVIVSWLQQKYRVTSAIDGTLERTQVQCEVLGHASGAFTLNGPVGSSDHVWPLNEAMNWMVIHYKIHFAQKNSAR